MPLLSSGEMNAIRELAETGMQTSVNIKRQKVVAGAYGDDLSEYTNHLTLDGWLYSKPSPVITEVGGRQVLINTYRLFLPVGTDVLSGDKAIINGRSFTVSDTDAESTWLPMMTCTLRSIE